MNEFDSPAVLAAWLVEKGIDTISWGRGGAKRATDFWTELIEGDCAVQDAPPLRLVTVVRVIITRDDHILIEAEQEFGDGQRRIRNRPPSEKMKTNENYVEGALRCLREELGIDDLDVILLDGTHTLSEELAESPSYPGLPTQYTFHTVEAKVEGLPESDFWLDNRSFNEMGDPVRRHRWTWRPIRNLASGLGPQSSH